MWSHHPQAYATSPTKEPGFYRSPVSPRKGGNSMQSKPQQIVRQNSRNSDEVLPSPEEWDMERVYMSTVAYHSNKSQYPVNLTKVLTGDKEKDGEFIIFAALWYDNREEAIRKFEFGLPAQIRGPSWQLVSRSIEFLASKKNVYSKLLMKTSTHMGNIEMDTQRTLACLSEIDTSLYEPANNILRAYSVVDNILGYSQGMNYIVAIILTLMPEENGFWFLLRLMKGYSLERLYPNSGCALPECFTKFEQLMQVYVPDLYHCFSEDVMTSSSLYIPQWFQTVFLYSQRMDLAVRVMDLIIVRGLEALFRVGLAILTLSQDRLIDLCNQRRSAEALQILQTIDPELLPTETIMNKALEYPNDLLMEMVARSPPPSAPARGTIPDVREEEENGIMCTIS